MNKFFTTFFLIILFSTSGQTFPSPFSKSPFPKPPSPEDLKYLELLTEGKFKEHCKKNFHGHFVKSLNRMIWSAVKEKEYNSMTEAERLAFKNLSKVREGYGGLNGVVLSIAQRMELSPEEEYQELTKVINRFIKFREDVEKAKKISEKRRRIAIDQGGKKTPNKKTCLPEGLIDSSDRPDIPSNIILGEN